MQVEHLRARARALRSTAGLVVASGAIDLYRLAGPETWVGPTPEACVDALLTARRRLGTAHDLLTDHARILDRRADGLELRPTTLTVT